MIAGVASETMMRERVVCTSMYIMYKTIRYGTYRLTPHIVTQEASTVNAVGSHRMRYRENNSRQNIIWQCDAWPMHRSSKQNDRIHAVDL